MHRLVINSHVRACEAWQQLYLMCGAELAKEVGKEFFGGPCVWAWYTVMWGTQKPKGIG